MIDQRNLFRLQSRLTVEGKSIPVKTIEKDYVLTWILVGLSKLNMENLFVFKGGIALKKFYIGDYRFSEDLDFTLLNPISIEDLKGVLDDTSAIISDIANIPIAFNRSIIHTNSFTSILNFSGPLGRSFYRGEIKIDFTIDELLLYQSQRRKFFRLYKEYSDVPSDSEVLVYSIEEIIIEKLISVVDPRRNEPRDIYDIWFLLENEFVQLELLKSAFVRKTEFKRIDDINFITLLGNKKDIYERLWRTRLSHQILDLPHFNRVYRDLKRKLRNF